MKENPHIQHIVERMAPGALSRDGFLGRDPRPLEDILETDHSTVLSLGTTHRELAARLRKILLVAKAGLGTRVQISEKLVAVYREAMGRIPCPWGRCGIFAKGRVELINVQSSRRIMFTALNVHMIADHGFYQGRGSPYRLEPTEIYQLFPRR